VCDALIELQHAEVTQVDAAAAVRPGLITMIGFASATARAADRNERASPIVSIYIRMLRVCGSLPR
jgi:hypothetical protein